MKISIMGKAWKGIKNLSKGFKIALLISLGMVGFSLMVNSLFELLPKFAGGILGFLTGFTIVMLVGIYGFRRR